MVFGRIGMRYLFPQSHLHRKKLTGFNFVRALYHWYMFLRLPVRALKEFSKLLHFISSYLDICTYFGLPIFAYMPATHPGALTINTGTQLALRTLSATLP
jgi:hypothetical protein